MTPRHAFAVVSPEEAFASLGDAWRELLASSASDTIFLTPEWMEAWWRSCGEGRRGAVVTARRGGALVALAPLQVVPERWRGAWTFRTLRFLSDGTYDADYLDLVAAPDTAAEVAPELWAWLRRGSPLRFDLARWNEIPAASSAATSFDGALRARGDLIEVERVGAMIAALPPRWEDYVASLRPRMRTKIRSLRRDLEASHQVRLVACDSERDLDARLASLFDLHQRRWTAEGQGGVFAGARKRAFYHALSRVLLDRGWLRFHSLEVDGAFVAHQYCMGYRGTVYLLQEGYDPAWVEHGVGNVLRAMVLEGLIAEGCTAYDFLAGVTDHKRSWGGTVKESLRLFARGPTPAGALVALAERSARAIRARRRAAAPPPGPGPGPGPAAGEATP
ncbi:MAG TPA: GNAT family N-acetyltransferase [Acidobacteriota bacterium]|nr:GNAT family N-acetyltransferase [Acidobacteriota bacterium]